MSDEDNKKTQNEEVMISLEISTDNMEYRLVVRSVDGKALTDKDFLLNIEMWLHDVDESMGTLEDPNTQIH